MAELEDFSIVALRIGHRVAGDSAANMIDDLLASDHLS